MFNRKLPLFFKLTVSAAIVSLSLGVNAQEITMATWGGGVGTAWKQAFAEPFTEETGINARIVEVPTPEAQIRAQKDDPQFNAAISSFFEAAQMYSDGLLEDFDLEDFPALKDVPEEYLLKTSDGRLIGVSTYFTYYGIAVNIDMANADDFSSWKNLADSKWKDRLAITRPIYSAAYDLTMFSVAEGGSEKDIEKGIPLFRALAENSLAMYSSMAQMNQLLQRGEVVAAPYYSTRIWQMKQEGMTNVDMVIPEEGALMLPYLVVVPKGAKDRDAYMEWLNYVAQPSGQEKIADIAGYLPLNSTAKLSSEAEEILGGTLAETIEHLYQPDWEYIAKHRKERMELVEKIMAGIDD